jgi:hypothetical protein
MVKVQKYIMALSDEEKRNIWFDYIEDLDAPLHGG